MRTIERSMLLPHQAQQLYALVNDVERYPEYVRGCEGAQVLQATPEEMTARLDFKIWKTRHSITTRNRLRPPECIDIALLEGPLQQLDARWCFRTEGTACRVSLQLRFALANRLLEAAAYPVALRMSQQLTQAFCDRASALYGNQDS